MKKIFLADDSITIQKVVELTFSEGNYQVVCVGNGAQAMQRVSEVSPDIALLDVIMPERNGYEVCQHIKKSKDLGWMPVLLLTGTFEPYDERRAREVGADGRLTKPFESRALIATVEQLLAAHPRPGAAGEAAPAATMAAADVPVPPAAAQTLRMKAPAPRPAPQGQPGPPRAEARTGAAGPGPQSAAQTTPAAQSAGRTGGPGNGGAPAVSVPPEVLERAVRDAVSGISEKVIREVAWEIIPDLAEAIIRRRIRELEEEAEGRG